MTRRTLFFCSFLLACTDPGNATFSFRESVEQIHVWKAPPNAPLELRQGDRLVSSATTDEQGSFIFRKVAPGQGYVVHQGEEYTRELEVVSVAGSTPPRSFYTSQRLVPGYQYLKMRDGTELSVYVTLPDAEHFGPFPTVVNYSGYSPSKPGQPMEGLDFLCGSLPVFCDSPDDASAMFAAMAGYATVSVNIRGTGCSGGAYDYFETLQLLDGYDIIEIVAAQPWVLHNKVGMVGLSYPGITQLFVGKMKPPGLAAISPLSVIGNTVTTLVPGGILNDGFAIAWVTNVLDKAQPWGQGWERAQVESGDLLCEENQLLHSQRVDNVKMAREMPYYVPEIVDPLNPELWVDEIEVPVFLAGAWQDEQTGPFFGVLLDRFTGTSDLRVMVNNGVHIDAYNPRALLDWLAFLDLFVARKVPALDPNIRSIGGIIFDELFDAPLNFPPDRFAHHETHEEALAAWRAEPSVWLLYESGAGKNAGAPEAAFEKSYERWPPPPQKVGRWYLQADGGLQPEPPDEERAASDFDHDPAAGQRGILSRGGVWGRAPRYDWKQPAPGTALVFETEALDGSLLMAGSGSVDLWVRAQSTEADIEVNLSELRPDGQEMYVQSGWLRLSQRALTDASTELYPQPSHLEEDAQPLVPGEWIEARVAIAPFQHAFRAGSKIRLSIDTPGDSRAEWRFDLAEVPEGSRIAVAHDKARPSSLALPVLEGEDVPTALPACTLRGQQCREALPYQNRPAAD